MSEIYSTRFLLKALVPLYELGLTLREMRLGHYSTRDRETIPPPFYLPGPRNEAIP